MNTVKIILLCFLFAVGTESCGDSKNFPDEPQIEYVGINKLNFKQSQTAPDSIVFFLTFTDGDGDLGVATNGNDIEIIDSRFPNDPEPASLAMVPVMGSSGGISGDLQIIKILLPQIDLCCLLPNGRTCETLEGFPEDVFHYKIRIKDRSGNWSNAVETDSITILCD